MADLVRIERCIVKADPATSIVGADGQAPKERLLVGPWTRSRSEARNTMNEMADELGNKFQQAWFDQPKYVTQAQWDVIDMAQTQRAKEIQEQLDAQAAE